MRIVTLLLAFLISVPTAFAAYTEVPPFSATEFARQRGVFRWYRGCWWRVVDPNVYLLCNDDGTVYIVLPDGTMTQILREDAERLGLDDSGAGNFAPIHTGYDARGAGIDLPYGATAYERYRSLPISYPIRPSWATTDPATIRSNLAGRGGTSLPTFAAGQRNRFGRTFTQTDRTPVAGLNTTGGTGVFRSGGTTGGSPFSVGTGGGTTGSFGTFGGGGTLQNSISRGIAGSFPGSTGTLQGIVSRGTAGSFPGSTGTLQGIVSRGNGAGTTGLASTGTLDAIVSRGNGTTTNIDPNDPLNRPLHIACSGPYDYADGYLFGPIPCTWFPGVFGPVPKY